MHLYSYDGPVMRFGTCVESHFISETTAPSEAKARSNLVYQYKKKCGLAPGASITLPGKIVLIE